ncbi:MAG TPA: MFS transporter [Nitrospiria bacterium]|nr:MFS transporter [Nitrospiria bacterium]
MQSKGQEAEPPRNRWLSGLRGNVLILGVVSFLNDAASEMIYPLLPIFLTAVLGAGPAALGVIEGIAESSASFLKMASGFLSDRVQRRKRWVVGGYVLSNAARPLIGLASTWTSVLVLRFVDRVGKGVRTSPRDALIAESTSPEFYGKAFGFHRAADHAGVVGPLLATLLLVFLHEDLRTVFILSVIPGILAVALLARGIKETRIAGPSSVHQEPLMIHQAWRDMPKTLRRFVVILFLFTLGNSSDAFLLLKAQQLGVSVTLIPVLWVVLHLVKMGSSLPAGIASDLWGRKGVILTGWAVYAFVYGAFSMAESPWQAWVLFAVYGLYFGLTEGAEKALIADLAPPRLQGSAFGLYHLTMGIGALPASLMFGWIWQEYGDVVAFGMGATLALAASLLLWRLPLKFQESSGKI